MSEEELLARITRAPGILGGKATIRGTRIAVEHILDMLAAGDTVESLLEYYPQLERDDIRACLAYARRLVARERLQPPLTPDVI
jgi:uncharacterized protein (DUF433 family)